MTFDSTGANNFSDIVEEYEEQYPVSEKNAGTILLDNLQDRSMRAALWQSGWRAKNAHREAVEWWMWDWDFVFGIAGHNLTYYGFSEDINLSVDQRGFNAWLKGQAAKF
jgi:polyamine oxidase